MGAIVYVALEKGYKKEGGSFFRERSALSFVNGKIPLTLLSFYWKYFSFMISVGISSPVQSVKEAAPW